MSKSIDYTLKPDCLERTNHDLRILTSKQLEKIKEQEVSLQELDNQKIEAEVELDIARTERDDDVHTCNANIAAWKEAHDEAVASLEEKEKELEEAQEECHKFAGFEPIKIHEIRESYLRKKLEKYLQECDGMNKDHDRMKRKLAQAKADLSQAAL
ncbi:MAG: hypothetical protein MMC23_000259 [Stictis urceolatum]|nr:hypothetical protein [Stictis urceolata]